MDVPERLNLAEHFLGARIRDGLAPRRALVLDDREVTYGELHRLAGRYGNRLLQRGVRPAERVMLALDDGVDMVAALFGALRAGAVAVMINPQLGAEQIRQLLEYTGARALVFGPSAASAVHEAVGAAGESVGPAGSGVLLLDTADAAERQALERAPEHLEAFPSHRGDPAIWLFSGATTGMPKAVIQSHRSFVNTTELYGRGVLGLGPDDLTLSVPKLYFGYALGSNLLFPFAVGGSAVLFPQRSTPEALFERIERHRPSVLITVPTMVQQMVESPAAAGRDLSCLRLATSAGEALPVELYRRWRERFGVELLDGLGTAEMWHVFLSNQPGAVRPGTLGRAVPGFEVQVCDEEGRPLGAGEVGRLWVRGDSLALGYWQRPEASRQAFRGEWYASGDMVTMDPEGWVTYCGRADDMLKVSGKWLAPGELEDCLLRHPAVHEVAVVGARDPNGLVKPHAFVVPTRDAATGPMLASELQSWAKSRLEPYKYPRAVTFLPELPRTHLGKVDRGRLARAASQGDGAERRST